MIGRDESDKVGLLLITAPKSGTHLMIEIMQQAFGSYFLYRSGWGDAPENSVAWLRKVFNRKEMEDPLLSSMKKTRFMAPNHTTNSGFSLLAEAIKNDSKVRGIFLYRDPRDILISMVHSTNAGIWPEGHLVGKLKDKPVEQQYTLMLDKGGPGNTSFQRLLASYSEFWKSDLFLNVKYEDIISMRRGGSKNMQGNTIDRLAKISNCCSLEIARGLLSAVGNSSWTHRKGGARAGQWRDAFSPKVKEKAKGILGQQLINWGYEKDNDW